MIEALDPSYAALAPLLFVSGAACVGVLIEAFWPGTAGPRPGGRSPLGTARRLVARSPWRVRARSPRGERSSSTAPGCSCRRPSPGLGALAILLFAERALDPARSAFVTSAAVPAGSSARPRASHLDAGADRGLSAGDVRHRRHDAVRRANDLLIMFVAPRGAQPAAVPDLGLARGAGRSRRRRGQVLPARRFRLGVLPVRPGPGLWGHGRASASATSARPSPHRGQRHPPVLGLALLTVGLLFKLPACAVPYLDAGRLPGGADPGHRLHGGLHQGRRIRCILRCSTLPSGRPSWTWRPLISAVAIVSMIVGAVLGLTQTDLKRMLAYSSIAMPGSC